MQGGTEPPGLPPCTVVDNGNGTVDLPPDGCDYVSPADLHMMIDGLPPDTTINIAATTSLRLTDRSRKRILSSPPCYRARFAPG